MEFVHRFICFGDAALYLNRALVSDAAKEKKKQIVIYVAVRYSDYDQCVYLGDFRISMAKFIKSVAMVGLLSGSALLHADQVSISFELPQIAVAKYQRPFVAVWVEEKGQRKALDTVGVWYDDKKWLKDIRRWWRKAGRYDQELDGVTGATKPPGSYELIWDGKDKQGNEVSGEVTLYLEAVREHGNRTLLKQKINLGSGAKQSYELTAGDEIGPVRILVGDSKNAE